MLKINNCLHKKKLRTIYTFLLKGKFKGIQKDFSFISDFYFRHLKEGFIKCGILKFDFPYSEMITPTISHKEECLIYS